MRLVFKINRNMRCIEITAAQHILAPARRINRNMRCIEINGRYDDKLKQPPINRNMRCIEMGFYGFAHRRRERLIET